MAHVLLVANNTASASVATTKAAIESQGHTVTMSAADQATLDAVSLAGVDVLVANTTPAVTSSATPYWVSWFSARWAEGYPILLGGIESGAVDGYAYAGGESLGLIADVTVEAGNAFTITDAIRNQTDILAVHPIASNASTGGTSGCVTGRTYAAGEFGTSAGTAVFGSAESLRASACVVGTAVEVGDALLAGSHQPGSSAPARAVWLGWLYGGVDYTATGKQWIGSSVTWLAEAAPEPSVTLALDGTLPAAMGAGSLDYAPPVRDLVLAGSLPALAGDVALDAVPSAWEMSLAANLPSLDAAFALATGSDVSYALAGQLPALSAGVALESSALTARPDTFNRANGRTRTGLGYATFTATPTPVPPSLVATPVGVMAEQVKEAP